VRLKVGAKMGSIAWLRLALRLRVKVLIMDKRILVQLRKKGKEFSYINPNPTISLK
jgi:hypothetical protein